MSSQSQDSSYFWFCSSNGFENYSLDIEKNNNMDCDSWRHCGAITVHLAELNIFGMDKIFCRAY